MANESVSRETAIDAIVLAIVANDRWFDATDDELRQEAERLLAGAEARETEERPQVR